MYMYMAEVEYWSKTFFAFVKIWPGLGGVFTYSFVYCYSRILAQNILCVCKNVARPR